MHWLPLVAMVIASALPFPHNPVSRIAAATTEPGFDGRRERRRDPAARLAAPPADYSFHGNASETDLGAAAAVGQRRDGRGPRNHGDSVKSTTHAERSTAKAEDRGTPLSHGDSGSDDKSGVRLDVPAEGGALKTEDISEHDSLQKDYKADGGSSSRQDYSSFSDFSWRDNRQDPTDTAEKHNAVGSVANPGGQRGPEPTVPSEQLRDTSTFRTGIQRTLGDGRGPADESLTPEAALGPGTGPDIVLEGNEMFLDAHPRVLFSPSLSPPEHPPLLLMLETGLLEEDWYGDEQEDTDGRIEGHGDWAMDPGAALGRVDSSGVAGEVARPIKRDKRSHLMDRRRGEQSVCESESIWVTDKKTAITSDHKNVTILQEIQTQTGPLKQFFYETRCRQPEQQSAAGRSRAASSPGMGVAGAGCLGVDKKQWLSECKPKQSYVRALTKDANNRTGWRWIRIDSSCVCVLLSRAKQGAGRQVLMRNGRG